MVSVCEAQIPVGVLCPNLLPETQFGTSESIHKVVPPKFKQIGVFRVDLAVIGITDPSPSVDGFLEAVRGGKYVFNERPASFREIISRVQERSEVRAAADAPLPVIWSFQRSNRSDRMSIDDRAYPDFCGVPWLVVCKLIDSESAGLELHKGSFRLLPC